MTEQQIREAIERGKDVAQEWNACDPSTSIPAEAAKQIVLAAIRGNLVNRDKPTQAQRLFGAFAKLTADERQLITCALAGNHPEQLGHLRTRVIRELARVDLEKPRP